MPPIPLGGFILIGPPMFGCPNGEEEPQPFYKCHCKKNVSNVSQLVVNVYGEVRYLAVWWGPNCLAGAAVTRGHQRGAETKKEYEIRAKQRKQQQQIAKMRGCGWGQYLIWHAE